MIHKSKIHYLILSASIIVSSIYSASTSEVLKIVSHYLPSDPIVLEAGSRDGVDAEIMCQKWANGVVHAFEPVPHLFATTFMRLSKYLNTQCYQIALHNKTGSASMYICKDNDGASSLLQPSDMLKEYLVFAETLLEVHCFTLDDWAEKYNVDRIDFMWLDMEGNELNVLKSSSQIIKSVRAIYTEINFQEFRIDTPDYIELRAWLEAEGFVEVWKEYMTAPAWKDGTWQGNALFIRKEFINLARQGS